MIEDEVVAGFYTCVGFLGTGIEGLSTVHETVVADGVNVLVQAAVAADCGGERDCCDENDGEEVGNCECHGG